MRVAILCVLIGILSGCATRAPKQDLQSVFLLVREKKFDEAEAKLRSSASQSMLGNFDSYSGESVSSVSEAGNYIFARLQNTIQYCDRQLEEIKGANRSKSEDESVWDQYRVDEAKTEFERTCSENDEHLGYIQKISAVDFHPMFHKYVSEFKIESSRIEKQFSERRKESELKTTGARAAKEKYEQSPEYYAKKLCEMQSIVVAANSIIQRENEAAKVSGYVDKKKMYEAGQAVVINRKRIQHFGSEYKNKFEKDWNATECR